MRRGDIDFGIKEIIIAIFAVVMLVIITIVIIRFSGPSGDTSIQFGQQVAEAFD